jgi:hypothetical protein
MLPASKDPEREKEGQRDCDPTQECHSHRSFKSAAMVWSTLVQIIVYENSNPCCWTCSCKCHCWCNLLRKQFVSQNRRKPTYNWQLSHNKNPQKCCSTPLHSNFRDLSTYPVTNHKKADQERVLEATPCEQCICIQKPNG